MHHLGSTRSVSRREYLLHTPDAFVRTPVPGLSGGTVIVHAAPQMGARFAMSTIELEPNGTLKTSTAQSFVYVLNGEIEVQLESEQRIQNMSREAFCFLPVHTGATLRAGSHARLLLIEKPYQRLPGNPADQKPGPVFGTEEEIPPTALNGDAALQVRCLLPSDFAYDFAVNTMTYASGASLAQVEIHYMEHGLMMLEGGGVYRLGDDWHPVAAGDAIWMAPFCPQWFGAIGNSPAKYIIYKDTNRHVLA